LELTTAQRDSAEVHVVFAMHENAVLCQQANCRVEKQAKQDWRIHTSACVMTSDEGLQEAEQEQAKHEEKERVKMQKKAQKDTAEKENLVRQTTKGAQMIFAGSLGTKNKTDLQDLALVLGLSLKGKKIDLQQRIEDKFNDHPELKVEPRFSGLFRRSQKQPAPSNDDTVVASNNLPESQPPLQCCHFNITDNLPTTPYSMQSTLGLPSTPPTPVSFPTAGTSYSAQHSGPLTAVAYYSMASEYELHSHSSTYNGNFCQ
ncbi:hypothetical protein C0992_008100, partial [Termitomyces sp. T32_za158]